MKRNNEYVNKRTKSLKINKYKISWFISSFTSCNTHRTMYIRTNRTQKDVLELYYKMSFWRWAVDIQNKILEENFDITRNLVAMYNFK
jgi:hypothetical protein